MVKSAGGETAFGKSCFVKKLTSLVLTNITRLQKLERRHFQKQMLHKEFT